MLFEQIDKLNRKFIQKEKGPKAKRVLQKNKVGGFILSNFKSS